jgi:predicted lipoprotein with Yx(FWY)xxD motif
MSSSGGGSGRRRALWGLLTAAAAAMLVAVALTALAAAAAKPLSVHSLTVGTKSEAIVVNSKGRAVYNLVPETTAHPLCTSSKCLQFWPPVKVKGKAPKSIAGIKGKLTTWHRKGFTQLVLNGHPLYTFKLDTDSKSATGEGAKSFGGTWHVFKESTATKSGSSSSSSTGSTSSTTSSMPPPY